MKTIDRDFFTSFEQYDPLPVVSEEARVGPGPSYSYTGKVNAGWTGLHALEFTVNTGGGHGDIRLFDVSIPVTASTQLSYMLHPQMAEDGELNYAATFVAIDLLFSDGSRLSELHAVDQHGVLLTAAQQGASNTLYPNQWNYKQVAVGEVANGKTISTIVLSHASNQDGLLSGWLDDLFIQAEPPQKTYSSPAEYVNILRGSNSNGTFSRGNNFPAVAVPHGFNFWTPVTDAGSTSWLYSYQQRNNAHNRPELQAFSLSHETSPWMGDRQTFQFMPALASEGVPMANRTARALSFSHDNEVALPHYYQVAFDNGIEVEMTPTSYAAMVRFHFPDGHGDVLFDNVTNEGGLTLLADEQAIEAYTDVKSGLSAGATRMFIYATFDKPVVKSDRLTGEDRDSVTGYVRFEHAHTVTMRISTSLLSIEQAKKNMALDLEKGVTFNEIRQRGEALWNEKLDLIHVPKATEQELVTLYSNLYRLFLYPNVTFENTGTKEVPVYTYASPFSPQSTPSTARETGAEVKAGKPYVNNGFWDTYRTTWPMYNLLTPSQAGAMMDGFVQQYKDNGWIARWSSPGYANLMVGTSSDVAFADAYLKGINDFDLQAFYASALKNASVVSEDQSVGRKGLDTAIFKGYTTNDTHEGFSWAVDGYINDFAIGMLASELVDLEESDEDYKADAVYYLNRAQHYVHLYDKASGFYRGRSTNGDFPESFDPRSWGGDFTETNAWNMAFHVPHDGQGLANLYGGRKALAKKLDEFFEEPETAKFPGHYGGVIHEMTEARDVRMGMYGHSNQPSHHIVYMYLYAGQPWKTQEKVREVLSRLYLGSEIGQGYPGDEDNGEMSAWQLFSAAGLYPLQMGRPDYAIGAPYFEEMNIQLESGETLVIKAPGVSNENCYIQGVKLNGQPYERTVVPHKLLAAGATIEFDMGPEPSLWGTAVEALPTSQTDSSNDGLAYVPTPLYDVTDDAQRFELVCDGGADAQALTDDTSTTVSTFNGTTATLEWTFRNEQPTVEMYTITTGPREEEDPKSWIVEGSSDGENWDVIEERNNVTFAWRRFTKPFLLPQAATYSHYRLRVTENNGGEQTSMAQVEWLGQY
ncbi:GH92 family glycosyl hydrolase [Aureibacillus halotolerans]|nr:GH92 family glycosyl hydrolase [Aureibacillus halotolerans]